MTYLFSLLDLHICAAMHSRRAACLVHHLAKVYCHTDLVGVRTKVEECFPTCDLLEKENEENVAINLWNAKTIDEKQMSSR